MPGKSLLRKAVSEDMRELHAIERRTEEKSLPLNTFVRIEESILFIRLDPFRDNAVMQVFSQSYDCFN